MSSATAAPTWKAPGGPVSSSALAPLKTPPGAAPPPSQRTAPARPSDEWAYAGPGPGPPPGPGYGAPPYPGPPYAAPQGPPPPRGAPRLNPDDPYQVRALNVGLNPELPGDLLRRLSNTDYANANTAIHTALAETPDGAEFVYPPVPLPGLATFNVRLSRGSRPGCRRYVVVIVKGERATIAPPLENCSGFR